MDVRKIGAFLKYLRNEKGITQEQLAEKLGVSGRTVSRWETGNNLPDLSILVQIAEFYHVEIKEILNGEREGGTMDSELKETLLKVADYHDLERQKAARIGSISFSIMFMTCALVIVIQVIIKGDLSLVMGETAIFVVGGFAYNFFMVKSGIWHSVRPKSTPKKDFLVSIICTGVFSRVFCLILREKADLLYILGASACFFLTFSAVTFAVLRGLSYLSGKRADDLKDR